MKIADLIATVLLIVGGLNWGLWGAAEFDLVAAIFGGNTAMLAKLVYIVVGVAALYKGIRLLAPTTGEGRLAPRAA